MLLNKTSHICDIAVEDGTRIQAHSDVNDFNMANKKEKYCCGELFAFSFHG